MLTLQKLRDLGEYPSRVADQLLIDDDGKHRLPPEIERAARRLLLKWDTERLAVGTTRSDILVSAIKDVIAESSLVLCLSEKDTHWKHVKRGTVYAFVGYATGCGGPLEGMKTVVYRCLDTGEIYVREISEFMDGRFVRETDEE